MRLDPQCTLPDSEGELSQVDPVRIAFQEPSQVPEYQASGSMGNSGTSCPPPVLPALSEIAVYSGPRAASSPELVGLVARVFNDSFGFRPDGRPYRLSERLATERLLSTDYLLIAADERSGVGYLYGKEIPCSYGRIAWIESMAVLPLYRKQGIASALLKRFCQASTGAPRVGCVTPNPIAALVVSRVGTGKMYIGRCSPPRYLIRMLRQIPNNCFDLRGCAIDEINFRIKTGFSPLSPSDEREWCPRKPCEAPSWWHIVQNLPNEFETIVVIER